MHSTRSSLHCSSIIRLCGLFSLAAFTSSALADVETYAVRKEQNFKQTGDAVIAPSYFRFDAQLRTTNAGDLTAVTLTGPTAGPVSLTQSGTQWSYYGADLPTAAQMDAQYPDQNYTLAVTGPQGAQSFTVDLPSLYPDATPVLTGSTFSNLNAWNPDNGDFLMTFNSHSPVQGISSVLTYVTFYDQTDKNGIPISWSLPSAAQSLLLDGSLFKSGHEYYGYLQFFHDYADSNENHFGATKTLTTSFGFTTSTGGGGSTSVPDSGSTALLMAVVCGVFAMHRRLAR